MSSVCEKKADMAAVTITEKQDCDVPVSLSLSDSLIDSPRQSIPYFASKVQAGFPSPADDYIAEYLDLNHLLIKHPHATFITEATGESMIEAGIFPGDRLVVDRSIEPSDGNIVIAAVDGELTVKRLSRGPNHIKLLPANSGFPIIDITREECIVIWGVVTYVLHACFP